MNPDELAALTAAARDLLASLDAGDLADLQAKFHDGDELLAAVTARAAAVADHMAAGGEPVAEHEYPRLVAACLTWGATHLGVAANTRHAAKKFRLYRRLPGLSPVILVRIGRLGEADPGFLTVLEQAHVVIAGTEAGTPEDRQVVVAVAAAVTAVLHGTGTDPVGVTRAVLERARTLAAAHRVTGRPVPAPGDVRILANVDFLVLFGACAVAIDERCAGVPASAGALDAALPALVTAARAAIEEAARFRRDGEIDHMEGFHGIAAFLATPPAERGAHRRTPARAGWARRTSEVLLYPFRLRHGPPDIPDEHIGTRLRPVPDDPDADHVRYLLGWLVAALFDGVAPAEHPLLLRWLAGARAVDDARDLSVLVRRLAVASAELWTDPSGPPPRPDGVPAEQLAAVLDRIEERVDRRGIDGRTRFDLRRVMLDALPPLWTRRAPVIGLLASQLRVLLGSEPDDPAEERAPRWRRLRSAGPGPDTPCDERRSRQALVVAAIGACAPIQFVNPTLTRPAPRPCCEEPRRPAGAAGGPPAGDVCPHRPWGETGWVDTPATIGAEIGRSADAVRQVVRRYAGPWEDLLTAYRRQPAR